VTVPPPVKVRLLPESIVPGPSCTAYVTVAGDAAGEMDPLSAINSVICALEGRLNSTIVCGAFAMVSVVVFVPASQLCPETTVPVTA